MQKRFWNQPILGVMLLTGLVALSGCAYFNTFYSAKKSFNEAEGLYVTPDDRPSARQIQLYDQALSGATKIVVNYSSSKWVDDAVLMMGRSLTAKGEYDEARRKFVELETNFPDSELLDQGLYYRAESYRMDRRFEEAQVFYDSLFVLYPGSKMKHRGELQKGKMYVQRLQFSAGVGYLLPIAKRGGDLELDARINLAEAYFQHQQPTLGIASYKDALKADRWPLTTLVRFAPILRRLGLQHLRELRITFGPFARTCRVT